MNARFHREPWDEATRTEFISGMSAILAAYLRGEASADQANSEQPAEPGPSAKRARGRRPRPARTNEEARHG